MLETTKRVTARLALDEIRVRLDRLAALVEAEEEETAQILETKQLAAQLGVTTHALGAWARNRGTGAIRDGWRLLGRACSSQRSTYLWERVE